MTALLLALCGCSPSAGDHSKQQCVVAPEPTLTIVLEEGASEGTCTSRLAVRTDETLMEFECAPLGPDCVCHFYSSGAFLSDGVEIVLLSSDRSVKAVLDVDLTTTTETSSDGCRSWEVYDNVIVPAGALRAGADGMGGSF